MFIRIAVSTIFIMSLNLFSAYMEIIPTVITQPNGQVINCFITGDEYFNRLHDANDFTIIQSNDGWFYYGVRSGDDVVPSTIKVGETDPEKAGLTKGAIISEKLYREIVGSFNKYKTSKTKSAPTIGTLNNIVIFIRFSGESESIFNSKRSYYDAYFNKTDASSLQDYFDESSYGKFTVISHYYPHVDDFNTNLSYQDSNPREYYMPYNATSNPIGYSTVTEKSERESGLLGNAILAITDEIPTTLDIDGDKDSYVDNIVFLISGTVVSDGSAILWPHWWDLTSTQIKINRKRVTQCNLIMAGSSTYFKVSVIAHEFAHSLGAPDLYHYPGNYPDPVGGWDLLNNPSNPPPHMGAWMKYKYMKWIDEIPVISQPCEYTLNPLTSPTGNVYKINPSYSAISENEFFILEYRKQTGIYESSLPGLDDGILIYRIFPAFEGNDFGPPDEVYIFRPNGTTTVNGYLNQAQFSKDLGRTEFNLTSNPYPFLTDGSDGKINITNIGFAGETISFSIALNVLPPKYIVGALNYGSIELNWAAPDPVPGQTVSYYKIYKNGELMINDFTGTKFTDTAVEENISYKYSVSAYYTGTITGESSMTQTENIIYKAPYSAPYTTGFVTQTDWSQVSVDCTPRWIVSNTSNAGGSSPEMMAVLVNSDPAVSKFISPAVSTTGIDTLEISFRHFYDGFDYGVAYKVQISKNKFDWTDTDWAFEGTGADAGPETAVIDLTEFTDPVYVAWTLDGNLWNYDGWYIDDISIAEKGTSSIEDNSIPSKTKLYGNYPNPFNPETTIKYSLSKDAQVNMTVFDNTGGEVYSLVDQVQNKGWHEVKFNGDKLTSGIFFYRLCVDDRVVASKKMILIK